MREVCVIDAVRTPIGRYRGALRSVRPDDMMALVISALVERTGIDPALVNDVIVGCANQAGEDNRNVARMSLLLAGFPVEVPGMTVNRLCGSGLSAISTGAVFIQTGYYDVVIAGGVESMTRAPFVMAKPEVDFPRGQIVMFDTTIGWRFTNPRLAEMYYPYSMGETAENVAEKYGIGRQEQDRFAYESHMKAAKATEEGRFRDEIIPVEIKEKKTTWTFDRDEHIRPDTTLEKLAKLRPAFRENGTVTAGNSSGVNDGASAVLLMSVETAEKLGFDTSFRIISCGVAGVDPAYMGLGPVPATRMALSKAGLEVGDIDLVELNEAFAVQSIACIRDLGLAPEKVNVNGGAIALGHPLGCSGARIFTTLFHEMKKRKVRYGLATMCIGVGQGVAAVVEYLEGRKGGN